MTKYGLVGAGPPDTGPGPDTGPDTGPGANASPGKGGHTGAPGMAGMAAAPGMGAEKLGGPAVIGAFAGVPFALTTGVPIVSTAIVAAAAARPDASARMSGVRVVAAAASFAAAPSPTSGSGTPFARAAVLISSRRLAFVAANARISPKSVATSSRRLLLVFSNAPARPLRSSYISCLRRIVCLALSRFACTRRRRFASRSSSVSCTLFGPLPRRFPATIGAATRLEDFSACFLARVCASASALARRRAAAAAAPVRRFSSCTPASAS